jgi:hypothetical protein
MPETVNLKEERFILADSFGGYNPCSPDPLACGQADIMTRLGG